MDAAVQDRLIGRNPGERIKLPRLKQEEAAYFEPDVVDRIIDEVDETYRLLFRVLAVLGLRWGEAAALRRRDVDLLRRRLRIEKSLAEVEGKFIFGSTKSHAVRTLPIPRRCSMVSRSTSIAYLVTLRHCSSQVQREARSGIATRT
jgi:integrase